MMALGSRLLPQSSFPTGARRSISATSSPAPAEVVPWPLPGIRTVQYLIGHVDVGTRQIYTQVMQRPGLGVRIPLDCLQPKGAKNPQDQSRMEGFSGKIAGPGGF